MNNSKKNRVVTYHFYHYARVLAVVWTVIISASLAWNINQVRHNALVSMQIQARVAYEKDIIYRRWNTANSGVYVQVTETIQPNPYLSDIVERDIVTPSGRQLTLMNPAYMTRLVHELAETEYDIYGHITSLNPIRAENAPDPWEAKALQAFELGETEISSVEEIEGKKYMRLMRPLFTEKGCLRCHATQGYQEGDIRGGISVSIPVESQKSNMSMRVTSLVGGHLLLWLAGLGGIVLESRKLRRSERERKRAEKTLRESEKKYRDLVESSPGMIFETDTKANITFVNNIALQASGYSEADFEKGMSTSQFINPEDIGRHKRIFDEKISGMDTGTTEYLCRRKDGSSFPVIVHSNAMTDDEGNVVGTRAIVMDISERKQLENALQDSEERYRALFVQAAESIVLVDGKTGELVEFNDRAHKNLGYTRKEFKELKIPDFEVIEHPKKVTEHIKKIIREGTDTFETKHKTKSGEIREVQVNSKAISIAGRDFVQSMWTDITDSKRAMEAIWESEEKYRSLMESTDDSVYAVDGDCRYVYMNEKNLSRLGVPSDKVIGKRYSDFHSKEGTEKFEERIKQVLRTGKTITHEYQSERDGKFFLRTYSPVRKPDDKPNTVIVISKDITEYKQAEEALRASEEKFRSLSDNIPGMIYRGESDWSVDIISKVENISGYSPEEFYSKGVNWFDIIHPEDKKRIMRENTEMVKNREDIIQEYRIVAKDGSIRWVEDHKSSCFSEDGRFQYTDGVVFNVTERKLAEAKISDYQNDLKRLSAQIIKSQEEESRRISRELHDEIGQALTGVSINLSAIQGELPQDLSPGMKDKFSETGGLVDTMLEQVQSISLDLRPSILDDLGLIPALRWYTESFKKRTNIKTQFQIVNVKKGFQPEIDTTIYRIVQEALTNVARHAEADLVRVRLKGKKSQIEVSIEDNGKGFELEDARSPYPTTHGIGLFGIQERVALLDGNTQILTKLGMGTKIIINIPIGVQS